VFPVHPDFLVVLERLEAPEPLHRLILGYLGFLEILVIPVILVFLEDPDIPVGQSLLFRPVGPEGLVLLEFLADLVIPVILLDRLIP
jgi:hypothetical protein